MNLLSERLQECVVWLTVALGILIAIISGALSLKIMIDAPPKPNLNLENLPRYSQPNQNPPSTDNINSDVTNTRATNTSNVNTAPTGTQGGYQRGEIDGGTPATLLDLKSKEISNYSSLAEAVRSETNSIYELLIEKTLLPIFNTLIAAVITFIFGAKLISVLASKADRNKA